MARRVSACGGGRAGFWPCLPVCAGVSRPGRSGLVFLRPNAWLSQNCTADVHFWHGSAAASAERLAHRRPFRHPVLCRHGSSGGRDGPEEHGVAGHAGYDRLARHCHRPREHRPGVLALYRQRRPNLASRFEAGACNGDTPLPQQGKAGRNRWRDRGQGAAFSTIRSGSSRSQRFCLRQLFQGHWRGWIFLRQTGSGRGCAGERPPWPDCNLACSRAGDDRANARDGRCAHPQHDRGRCGGDRRGLGDGGRARDQSSDDRGFTGGGAGACARHFRPEHGAGGRDFPDRRANVSQSHPRAGTPVCDQEAGGCRCPDHGVCLYPYLRGSRFGRAIYRR